MLGRAADWHSLDFFVHGHLIRVEQMYIVVKRTMCLDKDTYAFYDV
jgi:hypothetical protein